MYSEIENLADRFEENFEESGTEIVLKWNEWPAGTTRDAVTEKKTAPAGQSVQARTQTIMAFLYFVSASAVVRQFAEVQVGDCIVDYPAAVDVSGREDLVAVIEGEEYVAKPVSHALKQAWTEMQNGVRLYNTLLLRRNS